MKKVIILLKIIGEKTQKSLNSKRINLAVDPFFIRYLNLKLSLELYISLNQSNCVALARSDIEFRLMNDYTAKAICCMYFIYNFGLNYIFSFNLSSIFSTPIEE
jgi:hypothetical protein